MELKVAAMDIIKGLNPYYTGIDLHIDDNDTYALPTGVLILIILE